MKTHDIYEYIGGIYSIYITNHIYNVIYYIYGDIHVYEIIHK